MKNSWVQNEKKESQIHAQRTIEMLDSIPDQATSPSPVGQGDHNFGWWRRSRRSD
jgi:hypothetical protein